MPYSSLARVRSKMSIEGTLLRLDDVNGDITDVLSEADQMIEEHCVGWYTEANLATSEWIAVSATVISVMLLCERRGNPAPASVQRQYERLVGTIEKPLLGRLEQIRNGRFRIPGIPVREACVPVVSNQRPVLRPYPRMVTETRKSTGAVTDYTQKKDVAGLYDVLDYVI